MGLNSKDSDVKEEAVGGYKDSAGICIVIWKTIHLILCLSSSLSLTKILVYIICMHLCVLVL